MHSGSLFWKTFTWPVPRQMSPELAAACIFRFLRPCPYMPVKLLPKAIMAQHPTQSNDLNFSTILLNIIHNISTQQNLVMSSTCDILKFYLPLLMSLWHFLVILLLGHSPRSSPSPLLFPQGFRMAPSFSQCADSHDLRRFYTIKGDPSYFPSRHV